MRTTRKTRMKNPLNANISKKRDSKRIFNLYSRLNVDNQRTLETYIAAFSEKLGLLTNKKLTDNNLKRIYHTHGIDSTRTVNTDFQNGVLLSADIEPEIYVFVQKQLKKMTGKYWPMNDFIVLLLNWFYQYYNENNKFKVESPLVKNKKTKKNNKICLFENKFRKYYKNIY